MTISIPNDYQSKLTIYETQKAIGLLKRVFEKYLAEELNLTRVSAPLFVDPDTGLNDNLNGYERPVDFLIPAVHKNAEVVHSLAKWKRIALCQYGFQIGEGIYTDMNAIRRDETVDAIHSVYVDQWDWEKVMRPEERTLSYLKETVSKIVRGIYETALDMQKAYPVLQNPINPDVFFLTAEELRQMYPDKTPAEREYCITRLHQTVFLMQIGKKLGDGTVHGGRAPDYDDWELNGDLLCYHPTLDIALEISSMGIRVNPDSLDWQLTASQTENRRKFPYHQMLLAGKLPQTIGGGIGQSRLCMLLLEKAHIGEVQSSVWSEEILRECREANIPLL